MRLPRAAAAAALLLPLAACATRPPEPASAGGAPRHALRTAGGHNVLRLADVEGPPRAGPLSHALRGRFAGLQVSPGPGGCPVLAIRGRAPAVYLDGARLLDACLLGQLAARDVAEVRVYPGGLGADPRYIAGPGGLVLIVTRTSGDG